MAIRARSPSPSTSAPPTKRPKLSSTPDYGAGLHLAPMVRIGTCPTRLIALENGANLVWGPEIVDKAIIGATREVDLRTGTIKYMKKGRSIFECHPIEKPYLIFQLGSADPKLAVEAALLVAQDVAGVGLNCGCPKPFSLSGGMGAALLRTPDKICEILTALVEKVPVPVDVKIRMLPDQAATIDLVTKLSKTGVSAITVHCRTEPMRSSEPALLDRLQEIVDAVSEAELPIIANGDCYSVADQQRICDITGTKAIMIARGAESNPSCFSPTGSLDPTTVVIPHYIKLALILDNHYSNTKYCITAMNLGLATSSPEADVPTKKARIETKQKISQAKTYPDLCALFGIDEELAREGTMLESLLPRVMERTRKRNEGEGREKEGDVVAAL